MRLRALLTRVLPVVIALGFLATHAPDALACGGLVAPDGDVHLSRAATLVAWHGGIEHYLTSFTYEGAETNIGWIVPLPTVPMSIQPGGKWTLQRLFSETHPIVESDVFAASASASGSAQVLQQVKIEALNITVIKGSGQAVLDWCASNGFTLSGDTRSHLLTYAKGSPIFMAAKYDTSAVRARGQRQGDGAPVLITMRIAHPWVPLEVLALDGQQVHADLYLLTDQPLNINGFNAVVGQSPVGAQVPNAPGFTLAFQEQMTPSLYHDLSTDRNMGWVWPQSWLTYLSLDAPSESVTYDLGVTSGGVIRVAPFGTAPLAVASAPTADAPSWLPHLPLGAPHVILPLLIALLAFGAYIWLFRRYFCREPLPRHRAK